MSNRLKFFKTANEKAQQLANRIEKATNNIDAQIDGPELKVSEKDFSPTFVDLVTTVRRSNGVLVLFSIFACYFASLPDTILLDKARETALPSVTGLTMPIWEAMAFTSIAITALLFYQNLYLRRLWRLAGATSDEARVPTLALLPGLDSFFARLLTMFVLPVGASLWLAYQVGPIPRTESQIIFIATGITTAMGAIFVVRNVLQPKATLKLLLCYGIVIGAATQTMRLFYGNLLIENNHMRSLYDERRELTYWEQLEDLIVPSFRTVNLDRADFRKESGKRADLRDLVAIGAYAYNADFHRADMRGVNFNGAHFNEADFTHALLSDVRAKSLLIDDFRDYRNPSFRKAYIADSDFSDTTISKAQFDDASIYRSKFDRVEFSRTNFSGAELEGVTFDGATFGGDLDGTTTFVDANLMATRFVGADIRNAEFRLKHNPKFQASIAGTNFTAVRWGELKPEESIERLCEKIQEGAGWQLTLQCSR